MNAQTKYIITPGSAQGSLSGIYVPVLKPSYSEPLASIGFLLRSFSPWTGRFLKPLTIKPNLVASRVGMRNVTHFDCAPVMWRLIQDTGVHSNILWWISTDDGTKSAEYPPVAKFRSQPVLRYLSAMYPERI